MSIKVSACLLLLSCWASLSVAQAVASCPEDDRVSMALCQTLAERNRPETFFAIRLQASREESYLLAQLLGLPMLYQRSLVPEGKEAAEQGEESVSEREPVLSYFGYFRSVAEAQAYFSGLERQLRSDFQAYEPSFQPLSRIDGEYFEFELQLRGGQVLAEEPMTVQPDGIDVAMEKASSKEGKAVPELARSMLPSAQVIYSIQLVSFKGPKNYRRFVDRHDSLELYCRRKQNGLYAVSLQQFSTYGLAQQSLQQLLQGVEEEAKSLRSLGAYVVKLPATSLQPCGIQASLLSVAD